MRTKGNTDDDTALTVEEQAALAAQRAAPEPEPAPEPAQDTDEQAAAPEVAGAAATEEQSAPLDEKGRSVPLATFMEEKKLRQETERRAEENQRKWEERFNQLLTKVGQQQPQQQPGPQQPAIPDFQADPAGYIVGTMRQQGASIEEQNRALQALYAQQQQAAAVADIQNRAMSLEADFRAATPDYDAAVNHLRSFRVKQLEALGWTDPVRRDAQIRQEAMGIAHQAMQNGRNPAEVLYEMAKVSGYAPAPPAQATPALAAGNGTPDPAQKLETVRRGQEQARGLSGVRGSGPSPMTLDKIMELPDDELLKLAKNPPPEVKRFFGAP